MFVLVRTLTYATIFIGLLIVFVPARLLEWSGVVRPESVGPWQLAGMIVGSLGALLAFWCVLTFAFVGRGTPAPFDPPRRLVVTGPYGFVRNPMVMGATLVLVGAWLYFRSPILLAYIAVFVVILQVFVVSYEEPTLREMFGDEYTEYCARVRRWLPRRRRDAARLRAPRPPPARLDHRP